MSKHGRILVAMSGGIDSSVCAALAVRALNALGLTRRKVPSLDLRALDQEALLRHRAEKYLRMGKFEEV